MSYLFDTNVLIYYFNGLTADDALHERLRDSFRISIITEIEFLGWGEFITEPDQYAEAKAFVSLATVYALDRPIAEQTIQLRQRYKTKTPESNATKRSSLNACSRANEAPLLLREAATSTFVSRTTRGSIISPTIFYYFRGKQ